MPSKNGKMCDNKDYNKFMTIDEAVKDLANHINMNDVTTMGVKDCAIIRIFLRKKNSKAIKALKTWKGFPVEVEYMGPVVVDIRPQTWKKKK